MYFMILFLNGMKWFMCLLFFDLKASSSDFVVVVAYFRCLCFPGIPIPFYYCYLQFQNWWCFKCIVSSTELDFAFWFFWVLYVFCTCFVFLPFCCALPLVSACVIIVRSTTVSPGSLFLVFLLVLQWPPLSSVGFLSCLRIHNKFGLYMVIFFLVFSPVLSFYYFF